MPETKDGIELIKARPVSHPGNWLSAVVVLLLVAMGIHGLVTNDKYNWSTAFKWLFSKTITQGVLATLMLTVVSMVIGTLLAITMAIMRQSQNPVLRYVATFYIWFFRGTPIYTQLIFWSLLPTLYPSFSLGIPFGPEFFTFTTASVITVVWMSIIGLSLNEGAYLAEIIRAGLLSVDKGQWEAATALGMPHGKIFRRIILPQAMRVIVPPLGNETISMLKTTSLVAAVPYTAELTYVAQQKGHLTFQPVPFLITACIWYLVITTLLMVIQHYIELHYGRGFNRSNRKKSNSTTSKQSAINASSTTSDDPFLEVTP